MRVPKRLSLSLISPPVKGYLSKWLHGPLPIFHHHTSLPMQTLLRPVKELSGSSLSDVESLLAGFGLQGFFVTALP